MCAPTTHAGSAVCSGSTRVHLAGPQQPAMLAAGHARAQGRCNWACRGLPHACACSRPAARCRRAAQAFHAPSALPLVCCRFPALSPLPQGGGGLRCRMGAHQSRTKAPARLPQEAAPEEPLEHTGFMPKNAQARSSCNTARVRRLIRKGRLGPCWMPLDDGEVRGGLGGRPVSACRPAAAAAAAATCLAAPCRVDRTCCLPPAGRGVPCLHGSVRAAQPHAVLPPEHL